MLAALDGKEQKPRNVASALHRKLTLSGKVHVKLRQHLVAEIVEAHLCNAGRERRAHGEHGFVAAAVVGVRIVAPHGERRNARLHVLYLEGVDVLGDRLAARRILHLAVAERYVLRRACRIAAQLVGVPSFIAHHIFNRHVFYRSVHDFRIRGLVAPQPLVVRHDLEDRTLRARRRDVAHRDVAGVAAARRVSLDEQHTPNLTFHTAVFKRDILNTA